MNICESIHFKLHELERFNYPFYKELLPESGIYIIFEKGEIGHDGDRVVHVGTHKEKGGLSSRICEIFEKENKDRSILRKNIGRSILKKENNPYLKIWDKDTTSSKSRKELEGIIDYELEKQIEERVSKHIIDNFSFVVIEEEDNCKRKDIKDELISIISLCEECKPSLEWLGNYSNNTKISESGLWNVQGLYKEQSTNYIIEEFEV